MSDAISRRSFLRGAAGYGLALGAACLAFRSAAAPDTRPNFLFLISDDQTFRSIHALNNPEVSTPNLDRLVSSGTVFTHAFNQGSWTGAVCIASRTMLATGLWLWHANERVDSTPLWGETLRNAGYDTYMTGKWHVTEDALRKSFAVIDEAGPGMYPSTNGVYGRPALGNTWRPDDTSLKGHWLERDGAIAHRSESWAGKAARYLREDVPKSSHPFFMYVAFHAPHDPRQAPAEYLAQYPAAQMELPPNFLPEHPFDLGTLRIRDELLAPFPRTPEAVRLHRSEYYAMITHLDEQIGRILDALEESGKAENTVVIFASDHGLAVGQHGLMGKQNQYDHSIRAPLILSGPGIPRGKRIDAMVYLHSLFATTCELAGGATPETVEAPSLAPLLDGRAERLHEVIYGAYEDTQRMARSEDYKLIVYPKAGRRQLFDLKADPWETNDLSDDPRHAGAIRRLEAALADWQRITGDALAQK